MSDSDATDPRSTDSDHMVEMHMNLMSDLFDDEELNSCYGLLLEAEALFSSGASEDTDEFRRAKECVKLAINGLARELNERREESSIVERDRFVKWCKRHPINELLKQDPFTRRACEKPSGRQGDAMLLEMIHNGGDAISSAVDTSALGAEIYKHTISTPACRGVRRRSELLASAIDRIAATTPDPHVLSVSAGYLREAKLCTSLKLGKIGRWLALDTDIDNLEVVQDRFAPLGVEVKWGSVRGLLKDQVELGEFDCIIAPAQFDYLEQPLDAQIVNVLFARLRPGGELLISSFLPSTSERGYMESFMNWHLTYRDEKQLRGLTHGLDKAMLSDVSLESKPGENPLVLKISKK